MPLPVPESCLKKSRKKRKEKLDGLERLLQSLYREEKAGKKK
jgi:hypothetical protein